MIVAVKNNGSNNKLKKIISLVVVVAMFVAYYFHMSDEFSPKEEISPAQLEMQKKEEEEQTKARDIEKLIFREIETAVDLVGQEYVQDVKLVKDKILITCDTSTNLDPIKVRYGTLALIKNDLNNIKIAIDIKFIIESKLNEN